MDKKYAIVDMDGTLVDSMGFWKQLGVEYLTSLSYAVMPQLERLAGQKVLTDYGVRVSMDAVLAEQRAEAAAECADWRSWNLSAALAAGH